MHGPDSLAPGVSVVIPVKDRAALLAATLRSVGSQTVPPAEVIVVDDGSRDDSAAVARAAGATVLAAEPPGGPAAARNAGLARVSTELVCPLDSDDLMLPRMLELLGAALAGAPAAPFAFGRALIATTGPGGWGPVDLIAPRPGELDDPLGALFARNYVASCAVLARTAQLRAVGGYPDSRFMEDHMLWVKLARRGAPAHVAEVVSVYRQHPGNRHDPVLMGDAVRAISALATDDPRLAERLPERRGVQLVDLLTPALRRRQAALAARATWELLITRPHRARALRAGVAHWRDRRRTAAAAREAWHSGDVAATLSSFG